MTAATATTEQPTKMKLPRDSMIAYIPLSVTADLGVAMRRVRAKRISKIRQLCPSLFQTIQKTKSKNDKKNDAEDDETKSQKSDIFGSDDDSEQRSTADKKEITTSSSAGGVIRREQFGSIVEYLEAKYAKGVMLDDLDERIRERKKQKKKNKEGGGTAANSEEENGGGGGGGGNGGSKNADDMSVLSDSAAGSCYSIESGHFIDDSELRKEVAHQILGSSAYGKTKIEAKATAAAGGAGGLEEDNSMFGDDDHGFFVNIGDLEMEDGWTEHDLDDDEDWMKMMAKVKGKKRKRSTKDTSAKESEKAKKKVKKQKDEQQSSSTPQKKKKNNNNKTSFSSSLLSDLKKKKSKNTATTDSEKKKKNKSKEKSHSPMKTKEKNKEKSNEKQKEKSHEKNKEKVIKEVKEEKKITSSSSVDGDNKPLSKMKSSANSSTTGGDDEKKKKTTTEKSSVVPKKDSKEIYEMKIRIDLAKKDCTNLKRRVTRLYKKCIDEIKKLKDDHLPRKAKKGVKSKVSIIVPEGKKTGDKISFNNPHDPSQKLQVLIPDKYEAGETFKVSVPMPTVTKTSSNAENKFSKESINALDEYSLVYDEWCISEAKYRDLLPPKKKVAEFKVGTERLKKYDAMLEEFPKNLETPIDAPFLRKVVRRKRQNENKRMKLLEESGKKVEIIKIEKKKKREPPVLRLNLPKKGEMFPEKVFNSKDFGK